MNAAADLDFAAPRRREAPVLGSKKPVRVQCASRHIEEDGGRERPARCGASGAPRDQLRQFTESSRPSILSGDKASGATASHVLRTLRKSDRRRLAS